MLSNILLKIDNYYSKDIHLSRFLDLDLEKIKLCICRIDDAMQ